MRPLVSILIPAYNADLWIADALRSALLQTWPYKEIIVVDDGSKDNTCAVARAFEQHGVRVISGSNQGAAAARNTAYSVCRGDYIQWLDADDVLAPDKLEKQLAALRRDDDPRVLLSSSWASFYYRTSVARFIDTPLCTDLRPAEWLNLKMGKNLHMQTATWLTSRELAEAAGPWDEQMLSDDDGEYFSRVLLHCSHTRFVADTGVYYRVTTRARVSHVGPSPAKQAALLMSMKLHVQYLLSLENTARTRQACLHYLQTWYGSFSPHATELVAELHRMAFQLGGTLNKPQLRPKYCWMEPFVGQNAATWTQETLPYLKSHCMKILDKLLFDLDSSSKPALWRA